MCISAITLLAQGLGGVVGSTAAGATAAAATTGGTLQTLGMIAGIGGSLYQGIAGMQAAKAQAAAIGEQRKTEAQLTAIEDNRKREAFRTSIAQQRSELAARGVDLDSPTAVLLGQTAAQEMSFESQAVRSGGAAKQTELSYSQSAAQASGVSSLLKGGFSAAGTFLTAAPDIWPGLSGRSSSSGSRVLA